MSQIFVILVHLLIFVHSEFPKIFWTYWQSGRENHAYLRVFDQHHRKMIEKDGWEVRNLNKTSALAYLRQVPLFSEYEYEMIHKNMIIQHRSDYIRCLLMSHYGGVYFDMTTLIVEDFSWLKFENLNKNIDVRNKYGDSPEVLMFTTPEYGVNSIYQDPNTNQKFDRLPGYEIWFLASVPNSKFFNDYCPLLTSAYLNDSTNKQGYQKYIRKMIDQQQMEQAPALKTCYYLVSITLFHIQLQKKQKILDELSISNDSSKQLAVWYYKIWHISSLDGPFAVFYFYGEVQLSYFALYSLQQIDKVLNVKPKYFVKLTSASRDSILNYFVSQIPFYDIKRRLKCYFYSESYCTVFKDSFMYDYLVKDSEYVGMFNIKQKVFTQRSVLKLDNQETIPSFFYKIIQIIVILIVILLIMLIVIISLVRLNTKYKKQIQSYKQINQDSLNFKSQDDQDSDGIKNKS